jgi:hypothetical protein
LCPGHGCGGTHSGEDTRETGHGCASVRRTYLANAEIALFGNDLGDTFAFHCVKHIFSSGTQLVSLA